MLTSFKKKDFSYPFIIWIIVVVWYLAFVYNFFDVARLKTQDSFASLSSYMLSRPPQGAENITIVAIDEISRRNLNLKWSWPRSITAQLIRNISSFSPKVIGLDIIFSGESQESEDKELISALKSHPGIILGYKLAGESKELPQQNFIEAAKTIGFVDKPLEKRKMEGAEREIDRVIRSIRTFYLDRDGNIDFSMDIELVANYLDIPRREVKVDLEKGVSLGNKLFIPSKRGITPLNYLVHYNEFATIPASLVLEKKISPSVFKDKIVLVGATDPLIHDEYLTPLGVFSGVSILGNSLAMILSKRFIYNLPIWQNFFIILMLGILILFINKKLGFGLSSAFTLLILLSLFIGSLYLRSKDIQFDYFSVFFLSFTSYAVSNVYKYSYLTYMRDKLRKLAIKDPLTGFYNMRYFLLKLDEELKDKSRSLIFLSLVVSNYRRLILDINFEELKSLIKLLSEYTESSIEKGVKKADFSRISQDIISVAVWDENKDEVEKSFKELLDKLNKTEFKVEKKTAKVSLKGVLLYKPKGKRVQSKEIIYNMESLLKRLREEPQSDFISGDLEEKLLRTKKEPSREDILDFLTADLEERNKDLEGALKELLESKKETEEAYFEVILSLVKALEEKDTFTQGHSERVANYAKEIAHQIGLSEDEAELIYKSALLHDIGKIGLPDYLLHKKGKLTEEEINLIRKHEIISVEILKPIKAFKNLLPIILHHHEHFDGTGYPHGLTGEMIPKGAQILAVSDAFDAITSGRGYKEGKSAPEAIKEIEKDKKQFNLLYIKALKKVLKI
ncbi:MAG: CHASE2 domain-containing protein [Candidatus Omnitrophica bacterium]|nr:CHASE2 domain-containing protein [Candidatus Omnitrophota bacterium]